MSTAIATPPLAATPRAFLVAALFPSSNGVVGAMRALRSAGRTEDTLGFAIPLEGDPTTGNVRLRGYVPAKRSLSPLEFVLTVIDPHRPPSTYQQLIAGQNAMMTEPVLGDLAQWVIGVHPFRIPLGPELGSGTWVLGRPNHAAAVAGVEGAAHGGPICALATLGIQDTQVIQEFAERIAAGQCLLTSCETDIGRAGGDRRIFLKHGGTTIHEAPILRGHRVQP